MFDREEYLKQIAEAKAYLSDFIPSDVQTALVLGSGFNDFAQEVEIIKSIPFSNIPHFPAATIKGHLGNLLIAKIGDKTFLIQQGRIHHNEGYNMRQVTFPVRLFQSLGIRHLILTNSSGGLRSGMKLGALYLVRDHINLMFDNPLIGPNLDDFGPRFPDMLDAYDPGLRSLGKEVAEDLKIGLAEGVYIGVTGPSYETKSEARFFKKIGADLIGMSTVPEVITAVHGNMKILCLSCVTEVFSETKNSTTDHEQVLAAAQRAQDKSNSFLKGILNRIC